MPPAHAAAEFSRAVKVWQQRAGPRVVCYAQAHLPRAELLGEARAGAERGENWLVLSEATIEAVEGLSCVSKAPLEWLHPLLMDSCCTRGELFLRPTQLRSLRAAFPLVAHALRARSACVSADEDWAACARQIAERTFGAAGDLGMSTLGLRRVHVDERIFSDFTASLLAACEPLVECHERAPRWDQGQWEFLRRARQVGLDEGGTLLIDRPIALLFTELDPRLRLCAQSRPAPLLCLLRSKHPLHAQAWEQSLVQREDSEDLSAFER